MKLNLEYLKTFVNVDAEIALLKEMLAGIGMEVDEVGEYNGIPVFEIEITPNRPDWLSHYGIAREIYAKYPGLKLSPLELYDLEQETISETFSLAIENSSDCGRYSSCIARDIDVTESSPAIKHLMESLGLKSINNVVDISNITLMTFGHPIHIFDLDKLAGGRIIVRRAKEGEKIVLLDGKTIDLTGEHLVIADDEKPVALAGIMGGLETGVTTDTKNILVESAYFDPVRIRKTAKRLDLRTDASYRFERGADVMGTLTAAKLFLKMLAQDLGKPIHITWYQDLFPHPFTPQRVTLKKDFPSIYTGIEIPGDTCRQVLQNLGFQLTDQGDQWEVEVPSHRVDIYGKQDLVEEIIRIYGYDKMESVIPLSLNTAVRIDKKRDFIQSTREYLTALGFFEVINYSFHSPEDNRPFAGAHPQFTAEVEIKNPIGKDFSILRNSLIPGLVRNTALNFNQNFSRVTLFEVGRIFGSRENKIQEEDHLCISASGEYLKAGWHNPKGQPFDLYLFKTLLATLLKKLFPGANVLFVEKVEKEFSFFKKGTALVIMLEGVETGFMGQINHEILTAAKIDLPVFAAEMKLDILLQTLKEGRFVMWNKYPSTSRDFSFLIDRTIQYAQLENVIREIKPAALESWELYDLYDGKNIPEGKVSFSMSFAYREKDRTMVSDEVNAMHNDFTAQLIKRLNLIQR
ncbi:MAG: phenylalanine--tRNA ligase subunit beta [Acidobacteria bacterium]|nr:phenylalanine--tRNA ligase subunit beta [Acidobacteriota bacterium]